MAIKIHTVSDRRAMPYATLAAKASHRTVMTMISGRWKPREFSAVSARLTESRAAASTSEYFVFEVGTQSRRRSQRRRFAGALPCLPRSDSQNQSCAEAQAVRRVNLIDHRQPRMGIFEVSHAQRQRTVKAHVESASSRHREAARVILHLICAAFRISCVTRRPPTSTCAYGDHLFAARGAHRGPTM